jgi:molybdenum cofactor cytidylyltransferase
VVLAAGKSTRMGRPKAALPIDGADTFLTRIVRTFQEAGVDDVVVVVGYEAELVTACCIERGVSPRFVMNAQYEAGQFSSLLVGLRAIDRPGTSAMLLTLVDVPLVSAGTVRAVMERYRESRAPIVRPVKGSLHGHPVLVDRGLFQLIRRADPAFGAKPIIRAYASEAGDVPVDEAGAFIDVDTPEEYAQAVEQMKRRG